MSESKFEARKKEVAREKFYDVDPGHKNLYKVGGSLGMIVGVFYVLVTLIAYMPGNNGWSEPPFVSAATFINTIANHARPAYITWSLFTLTDFLAVGVLLALYFALKGVNRDAILVGIGITLMSVILDAAVAEVGFFTATSLAVSWNAVTDPVLKAAYYVAANHAVLQTEFAWPYSYFAGFAGWIIISAVMRKSSAFGKWLGTFGLVASSLFVIDMALVYIVPGVAGGFILPLQWVFVVFWILAGVRLFSLGRKKNQLQMGVLTKEQQMLGK